MMDEVKKAREALAGMSRGDAATVLIAGVVGALIEVTFNPLGALNWYQTGALFGAGALGVKQALESAGAKRQVRKRADTLQALLSQDQALSQHLRRERELFELGVISIDEFKTSLNGVVSAYRERAETQQLPAATTQTVKKGSAGNNKPT